MVSTINVKRGLKNSAHRNWSNADSQLGWWTQVANNRLSTLRDKKKAVDEAGAELAALNTERGIKNAQLETAMGNLAKAKKELDRVEQDYPEAWAEAMNDPDLRKAVEDIRNH